MAGTTDTEMLHRVELFASLDDAEIAAIAAVCGRRSYERSQVVWSAGDPGDELLVVTTGELEVVSTESDGSPPVVLGRVRPGECCGELAVLLDERRSATVRAARKTSVLTLSRDAFRALAADDARIMSELTHLVSRRAAALARRRPVRRERVVVGVVSEDGVRGATFVSDAIAAVAATIDGVTVRRVAGLDDIPRDSAPATASVELVIADLGATTVDAADCSCDSLVVVGRRAGTARDSAKVVRVVNRNDADAEIIPINAVEPFVIPRIADLREITDPNSPAARVVGRLTRRLLGISVGIALGGGAAFGIAHVGVLMALEDAGIPVDVVAGTSMGSIVAIGWAAGLSASDMHAIAARIGNVRTTLSVLEPSLTGTGVINSARLTKIFSPLIAARTFEELVSPCQVAATDVETGERVAIGDGLLEEAFRASCAIPLVFTPFRLGGRTLVDGAMVDPVPVEVARDMGADIVVGVNVVPHLDPEVTTSLSRLVRRVNRLNPLTVLSGNRDAPSLVDVLMNSLQIVQRELGTYKAASADVVVGVDLPGFTWIEFYRALEIIELGRVAGEQIVKELRPLMADRVGTAR